MACFCLFWSAILSESSQIEITFVVLNLSDSNPNLIGRKLSTAFQPYFEVSRANLCMNLAESEHHAPSLCEFSLERIV